MKDNRKDDRLNSIPPLPRSIKQKIYQKSIKQKIAAICYAIIFGFFAFFGLVCLGAGETDVGVSFIFIACIMLLVAGLFAKRRWEKALSYLLHARLPQLDISLPSNSEKTQSNARSQESGQLFLALRWRDVFKFWSIGAIVLLIANAITIAIFIHVLYLIW